MTTEHKYSHRELEKMSEVISNLLCISSLDRESARGKVEGRLQTCVAAGLTFVDLKDELDIRNREFDERFKEARLKQLKMNVGDDE